MNTVRNNKTILIAPLDWGLGHATRCIPVINTLLAADCKVLIAASGKHAVLLQQEFPQIEILPLPGYGIRYGKGNLIFQLMKQLPSFFKSIRNEYQWLQKAIEEHRIDAVISDNRYGLHSKKVPSVFITHQLQVLAPGWMNWSETIAHKQIYKLLTNFTECWVPDEEDFGTSLGKKLSHPKQLPNVPVRYIGWLTRFVPIKNAVKKYRLMISLSGPEPQRTMLEENILNQLKEIEGQVLLIRGLPGIGNSLVSPVPNLAIINHLPADEMQQAMAESEFFLSRCGYSTLMDLQAIPVRCIFIPTPGQTEQEYLGQEIAKEKKAVVGSQENFDLKTALQQAVQTPFFSEGHYKNTRLNALVTKWLVSF
jgi:predicted glycosyltransferase